MDTFESLQKRRVRKIDETRDARSDGKKRLFQTIKNIDFMFRHLKNEDPEGYRTFITNLLKNEIKELEEFAQRERNLLNARDVIVKEDIISQLHILEERIEDINGYLQELAEGSPEPTEA